uniref:Reverse transcriptase domain-containing protein n=1 Tax=Tanacetum cinerariifolium TaxID=118510 RepID=A0A699HDH3_TANCI|nr:reverse transcriptase domain-containing protein [Tanacetum cinerariifolium]
MSSPNHPTSDIEGAFSSTRSLDYTPASLDYVPASLRKTYSSSLDNSFSLVLIASPTLSLFHDDPYIKVMHAYYDKESPIPPPVIMPLSPMLSLMFNPQEFFVPEELLPPKEQVSNLTSSSTDLSNPSQKQACILVPPSFSVYTPTPPQIFEIEKSSIKMHLKHHEKQIKDILNYLEEFSFHRIEKIEERLVNGWMIIQRDFDELKTKLEKVPQTANMANADNTNRNPEPREVLVARKYSYKEFMSCQPFNFKDSVKIMEAFIGGLPQSIEGNATASKPQTLEEAINITQRLMDQLVLKVVLLCLTKKTMCHGRLVFSAPTINQSAIRQLIDDHFTAALEAQAANMANTGNINRNPKQAHIARKCRYKEFMSCQPFNFKGSEGAVELICWFECTESVFSSSNCIEDCKVKFATGTLTKEALSWWNSFAQPIGIEEAYKITWVEFKKLLI